MITIIDDPSVKKKSTPILEELPSQQHTLPVDVPFTTPSSPTHTNFDTTLIEYTDPSTATIKTINPLPSSTPQVPQSQVPLKMQPEIAIHSEPKIGSETHILMDQDPPWDQLDTQDNTHSTQSTRSIKEQIVPMLQDPCQCQDILEMYMDQIEVVATLP
jgi:hypothetical protein